MCTYNVVPKEEKSPDSRLVATCTLGEVVADTPEEEEVLQEQREAVGREKQMKVT